VCSLLCVYHSSFAALMENTELRVWANLRSLLYEHRIYDYDDNDKDNDNTNELTNYREPCPS
jgi:hypothetical protein